MKKIFLFSLSVLILFNSCKKEIFMPFKWVKAGNKLSYDYSSSQGIISNALTISLRQGIIDNYFNFDFGYNGTKHVDDDDKYNIYREKDGLYKDYPNYSTISFHTNSYLWIGKKNIVDTYYPIYDIAIFIKSAHKVIEVNKSITVPAGTYKTTVLQDTLTLKKEYISERYGIIKFELFDKATGALIGEYNLASTNF